MHETTPPCPACKAILAIKLGSAEGVTIYLCAACDEEFNVTSD